VGPTQCEEHKNHGARWSTLQRDVQCFAKRNIVIEKSAGFSIQPLPKLLCELDVHTGCCLPDAN